MLIFRGLYSASSDTSDPEFVRQAVALTIGNFDGVHLGHQALLNQLREAAKSRGLRTAVLTFEPHPREFFMPQQAPARLTSMREKLEFFAELGIDQVYVCRFNARFAQMTAQDFMQAICQKLTAKFILVGDDFRFGRKRAGDFALMNEMSAEYGVTVQAMSSVHRNDVRISSTAVRAALAAGDLLAANSFLGRAYSMSGRVVHGDGVGKKLGFPTANIQLKHNFPPLAGIFVVCVTGDDMPSMQGVASLGVRPTVSKNGKPVLEVHIFNFSNEIYNKHLRVEFLHKLRDEEKYPNLEILIRQISQDVQDAKSWFTKNDKLDNMINYSK